MKTNFQFIFFKKKIVLLKLQTTNYKLHSCIAQLARTVHKKNMSITLVV